MKIELARKSLEYTSTKRLPNYADKKRDPDFRQGPLKTTNYTRMLYYTIWRIIVPIRFTACV